MEEQFNCDVCKIKCSGIEPYMMHMTSNKHKKKVEQEKLKTTLNFDGSYYCQMCDVSCSGAAPYKQHLMSEKHVKRELAKPSSGKHSFTSDTCDPALPTPNQFQCPVCVKSFTGPIPYQQHMDSAVHKKNLNKLELVSALKSRKNDFAEIETPSVNHENLMDAEVPSSSMSDGEMVVDHNLMKVVALDTSANSLGLNSRNENSPIAKCYTCSVEFYSRQEVVEHYESERHLDNETLSDFKKKVKVFVTEPFDLLA